MRRGVAAGVMAVACLTLGLVGCGGSGRSAGPATTTPGSGLPAVAVGTSATTTGPLPTTATGGAGLPIGGAGSAVFGTAVEPDTGNPFSNLPPDTSDVDQARVNAAPLLRPIDFSLTNTGPWPSACALTDLKQLEALDPSITGLRGQPVGEKTLIDGVDPKDLNQPTMCTFKLTTIFDTPDSASSPSAVAITLFYITPKGPSYYVNGKNFNNYKVNGTSFVDYGNLGNGLSCFEALIVGLQCVKGDILFTINGQKTADPESVAGVNNAVWLDQIEIPLAEVLARELTGT